MIEEPGVERRGDDPDGPSDWAEEIKRLRAARGERPGGAARGGHATRSLRSTRTPDEPRLPARDPRLPTAVAAEGAWITDADGRRYLDGAGGAIVVKVGHGDRR